MKLTLQVSIGEPHLVVSLGYIAVYIRIHSVLQRQLYNSTEVQSKSDMYCLLLAIVVALLAGGTVVSATAETARL